MGFASTDPHDFDWTTRPHEPGEPARHVAELSEGLGLTQARANVWRYEPGAKGRRHRHPLQEETFVVLEGTLTMELGEPAERVEVPRGGVLRVSPGTALRASNEGTTDLVVYVHGWPREDERAEVLDD
jgi:quercetin dioxygenase-like cupin family protein